MVGAWTRLQEIGFGIHQDLDVAPEHVLVLQVHRIGMDVGDDLRAVIAGDGPDLPDHLRPFSRSRWRIRISIPVNRRYGVH